MGVIFGPKNIELTGGWENLRNEELQNVYSSAIIDRIPNAGLKTRM
jgi:hypothetical protein